MLYQRQIRGEEPMGEGAGNASRGSEGGVGCRAQNRRRARASMEGQRGGRGGVARAGEYRRPSLCGRERLGAAASPWEPLGAFACLAGANG